jgi:hypothetical protein
MRRSRSPASSCYTASAKDSSHCDVSAFKAELHLQSGTRCFGPERRTAKQGLSARAGYLHQSRMRKGPSLARQRARCRAPSPRRRFRPASDATREGWLEREIARAASSPDFTVSMGGLGGVVPFGTCHRAKAGLWIDFPAGRNVENRPEARPTLSGTGGQSRRAETGRRRLRNRFSLSRGPNQLRGPQ